MLDNNIYVYIHTNYITFTGFSSDWKHLKDLPLSWGVRKSLRIEVFMKSNHRQLPIVWRSSSRGWQDSWDPVGWQSPPSFPVEVRRCVFFGYLTKFDIPLFLLLFGLEVYSTSKKPKENKSITSPFQPCFQEPRFSAAWSLPKVIPRATPEFTHGDRIRPHPRSCAVARWWAMQTGRHGRVLLLWDGCFVVRTFWFLWSQMIKS